MSDKCCGCSTERVAGIVVVAGLALCIGAWLQPRSVNAGQDRALGEIDPPTAQPNIASSDPAEQSDPTEIPTGDGVEPARHLSVNTPTLFSAATTFRRVGDDADQHMFFELPDSSGDGRLVQISGGRTIEITDEVIEGMYAADFDGDGSLDDADMHDFADAFDQGDPRADLTGDGLVDSDDFFQFAENFETGKRNPVTILTTLVFQPSQSSVGGGGAETEIRASVQRFAGQSASITIDGQLIPIVGFVDGKSQ